MAIPLLALYAVFIGDKVCFDFLNYGSFPGTNTPTHTHKYGRLRKLITWVTTIQSVWSLAVDRRDANAAVMRRLCAPCGLDRITIRWEIYCGVYCCLAEMVCWPKQQQQQQKQRQPRKIE